MELPIKSLNDEMKQYLQILSPDFPEWLLDYINTPEMQRLDGIGRSCGTAYTKVYNDLYFVSTLSHSVGVALIIWHFTGDKKQTLAGLFHDIATPTFQHCIDFMNGDSEHQESTEERTEQTIRNSEKIMSLLNRDNIKVEEVSDYHIYPIADNDTPRLSADRFEYTFSGGLCQLKVFTLDEIKNYYNNIVVVKNEDGLDELAFKDADVCEKYINQIRVLWPRWVEDEDRLCMQFIADIMKSMSVKKYLTLDDMYKYSEADVINLIHTSGDTYLEKAFDNYCNATRDTVYKGDSPSENIYCTSTKGKMRYVNPLVADNSKTTRIADISASAQKDINAFLGMEMHTYVGFNFEFKPYEN